MTVLSTKSEPSATLHIQSVSHLTNLSVDTIRAWEKRYGAVVPSRGPAGQRRFSADDIARLALLKEAVDGGESISKVASLSTTNLRCFVQHERSVGDADDAVIQRLLRCVYGLDARELASVLTTAGLSRSALEFGDDVVASLMVEIGANARSLNESSTYELVLCSCLLSISSVLFAKYAVRKDQPTIVFLTLPGEKHSIPPLLAALTAAELGFRGVFVGTEIAPYHVESLAHSLKASALGIYVGVHSDNAIRLVAEVRKRMPQLTTFVGGQSARFCEALEATETLRGFAERLTRFEGL